MSLHVLMQKMGALSVSMYSKVRPPAGVVGGKWPSRAPTLREVGDASKHTRDFHHVANRTKSATCGFGIYSVAQRVLPSAPMLDVTPAPLAIVRAQADLQYHASPVRMIFNPPSATGMGFWSINPYVGCAFG